MNILVYQNRDCGTSRNVVGIVEAADYRLSFPRYLGTGWTRPQLPMLFAAADLPPRMALRTTKSPAVKPGLTDPAVDDEAICAAMPTHSVLVDRPIVCKPKELRLCRPGEAVLDLLDRHPPEPFAGEDSSLLSEAEGRRVG